MSKALISSAITLTLLVTATPVFSAPASFDQASFAGVFAQSAPAISIEAASPTTPSLEEVAASDPNLHVQRNEEGEVDSMVMLSDVLFGFGETDLGPEALGTLQSIVTKLGDAGQLTVIGHTDSIGSENGNFELGMERAKAVRDWMIEEAGLAPESVKVDSAGETKPIAENQTANGEDNAEGRALNRRVEFSFEEQEVTQDTANVTFSKTSGVI